MEEVFRALPGTGHGAGPGHSAGATETEQDLTGHIVILHTNDVHGAIGEYAKVAALKQAYQAAGAYVLLADAGDFIQGDPHRERLPGKDRH